MKSTADHIFETIGTGVLSFLGIWIFLMGIGSTYALFYQDKILVDKNYIQIYKLDERTDRFIRVNTKHHVHTLAAGTYYIGAEDPEGKAFVHDR